MQAVRKDGTLVDIEVRASSFYHNGELAGRQGIARDISELKRLQAEITEKAQRLVLLAEQSRLAMDLYHRLGQLTLDAVADPQSEPSLRLVQDSLQIAAAAKLGLTPRDLKIIGLLAGGCSNSEIGAHVHLSVHTVKDHVSRMMHALGARGRTELVAQAGRHGLLSQVPPDGGESPGARRALATV